jgi:GMP synthase-like glutamine amidotransferase
MSKELFGQADPHQCGIKNFLLLTFSVQAKSTCIGNLLRCAANGTAAWRKVQPSKLREYGRAKLDIYYRNDDLFKNINDHSQVWMSHSDTITGIPANLLLQPVRTL